MCLSIIYWFSLVFVYNKKEAYNYCLGSVNSVWMIIEIKFIVFCWYKLTVLAISCIFLLLFVDEELLYIHPPDSWV